MITHLYCIYDTIAEEAGQPFTSKNDGTAIRSFFHSLVMQQASNVEDYKLYKIGIFDNEEITLTALNESKLIDYTTGKEHKATKGDKK